MAKIPKEKAISILSNLDSEIDSLTEKSTDSVEFKKWKSDTAAALRNIFPGDDLRLNQFNNIRFSPMIISDFTTPQDYYDQYIRGLESSRAFLQSFVNEIETYWEEEESPRAEQSLKNSSVAFSKRKIFIVHGHDEGLKESVARFLSLLGLEPIILHEQPNQGRTIIEKFEQTTDVHFAIALLTPDDEGKSRQTKDGLSKNRARQNVIFEFGYFIGKLGRKNVCGLYKKGVELPSDYNGVLYVPVDNTNSWRFDLIRELKAAGFNVDANRAL